jgi:hypothetical protein
MMHDVGVREDIRFPRAGQAGLRSPFFLPMPRRRTPRHSRRSPPSSNGDTSARCPALGTFVAVGVESRLRRYDRDGSLVFAASVELPGPVWRVGHRDAIEET